MMRRLYPPLDLVEDELFAAPAAVDLGPLDSLVDPHAEYAAQEMPDFLRELVQRRVASQQAFASPVPLAAGQIRRLDHMPAAAGKGRALGRTCALLLGANLGANRWSGWLVTQETDYATDRDLVLQDHDGPLAPEAAMVQTWNPVESQISSDAELLGKLAPGRLAAVKMLAGARRGNDDFVAPRPGHVGAWDLDEQTTVVTGTPLGDSDDPRHAYQRLYGRLAHEINLAAQHAPAQPDTSWWVGALDWMRHALAQPALTLAAIAVAILQGIWIASPDDAAERDAAPYRSTTAAPPTSCAPLVRITFRPDSAHADVLASLRAAGATLVDGPTETGELLVRPVSGQGADALAATLRQVELVEQADAVATDEQRCMPQ